MHNGKHLQAVKPKRSRPIYACEIPFRYEMSSDVAGDASQAALGDDHHKALAEHYAAFWNDLERCGLEPTDQGLWKAADELAGGEWVLFHDTRDGYWKVIHHGEAPNVVRFAAGGQPLRYAVKQGSLWDETREPRDDGGKWTKGGAKGKKPAKAEKSPTETDAEVAELFEDGPKSPADKAWDAYKALKKQHKVKEYAPNNKWPAAVKKARQKWLDALHAEGGIHTAEEITPLGSDIKNAVLGIFGKNKPANDPKYIAVANDPENEAAKAERFEAAKKAVETPYTAPSILDYIATFSGYNFFRDYLLPTNSATKNPLFKASGLPKALEALPWYAIGGAHGQSRANDLLDALKARLKGTYYLGLGHLVQVPANLLTVAAEIALDQPGLASISAASAVINTYAFLVNLGVNLRLKKVISAKEKHAAEQAMVKATKDLEDLASGKPPKFNVNQAPDDAAEVETCASKVKSMLEARRKEAPPLSSEQNAIVDKHVDSLATKILKATAHAPAYVAKNTLRIVGGLGMYTLGLGFFGMGGAMIADNIFLVGAAQGLFDAGGKCFEAGTEILKKVGRYAREEEGTEALPMAEIKKLAQEFYDKIAADWEATQAKDKPKAGKYAAPRLFVYRCPYCGGLAYQNDPIQGGIFQGYALCSRCGRGFSILGKQPTERPMSYAAQVGVLRYAAKRIPRGYVVNKDGRVFRAGMWVSEADLAMAVPATKNLAPNADGPVAEAQRQAAYHHEKRRARGPVNRDALHAQKLQPHAHQVLNKLETTRAKRTFAGLHQHHGELTAHRVEELINGAHEALQHVHPDDEITRDRLSKRLRSYHQMLDWHDEKQKGRQPWEGGQPQHGGKVYNMPTGEIIADPDRFQFKLNVNKEGVTQELKGVQKWDPELAGVISVWKDNADGKTYVVNGHHRRELANRMGVKNINAMYIDAPNAKVARARGALVNIAEGRGTAVDAAKFMRDTGTTAEAMQSNGISLTGKVAGDAVTLTHLNDRLFNQVAMGKMPVDRAITIAGQVKDHFLQDLLVNRMDKEEAKGRDISPRLLGEMARAVAEAPRIKAGDRNGGQPDLFGSVEDEDSAFVEECDLKGYVRAELAKDVNDWKAVSSKRRVAKVAGEESGNELNVEGNRANAQEAAIARGTFDRLSNRSGLISDTFKKHAVDFARAQTRGERDAVKQQCLADVRDAIDAESAGAGSQPVPPDAGGNEAGVPGSQPGPQGDQAVPAQAAAGDAGRGDAGAHGVAEAAKERELSPGKMPPVPGSYHEQVVNSSPAAGNDVPRGVKGTLLNHLATTGVKGMSLDELRTAMGQHGQHAEAAAKQLEEAGRIERAGDRIKIKGAAKEAAVTRPPSTRNKPSPPSGSYAEQIAAKKADGSVADPSPTPASPPAENDDWMKDLPSADGDYAKQIADMRKIPLDTNKPFREGQGARRVGMYNVGESKTNAKPAAAEPAPGSYHEQVAGKTPSSRTSRDVEAASKHFEKLRTDAADPATTNAGIDRAIDINLGGMSVDQLKQVAKQVNLPVKGKTKPQILAEFMKHVKELKAGHGAAPKPAEPPREPSKKPNEIQKAPPGAASWAGQTELQKKVYGEVTEGPGRGSKAASSAAGGDKTTTKTEEWPPREEHPSYAAQIAAKSKSTEPAPKAAETSQEPARPSREALRAAANDPEFKKAAKAYADAPPDQKDARRAEMKAAEQAAARKFTDGKSAADRKLEQDALAKSPASPKSPAREPAPAPTPAPSPNKHPGTMTKAEYDAAYQAKWHYPPPDDNHRAQIIKAKELGHKVPESVLMDHPEMFRTHPEWANEYPNAAARSREMGHLGGEGLAALPTTSYAAQIAAKTKGKAPPAPPNTPIPKPPAKANGGEYAKQIREAVDKQVAKQTAAGKAKAPAADDGPYEPLGKPGDEYKRTWQALINSGFKQNSYRTRGQGGALIEPKQGWVKINDQTGNWEGFSNAHAVKKLNELKGTSSAPRGGASSPKGYRTSQGSSYELHDDGTTTRTKSSHAHVGHDANDQGLKERSAKTVYVPAKVAAALSSAGLTGPDGKPVKSRVIIKDGKATLLTWNHKENRWGAAPSGRDVQIHDKPSVGMSPLELWKKTDDIPGHEAYSSMHAGNEITEMLDGGKASPGVSDTSPRSTGDTRAPKPEVMTSAASRTKPAQAAQGKNSLGTLLDNAHKLSYGQIDEEMTALAGLSVGELKAQAQQAGRTIPSHVKSKKELLELFRRAAKDLHEDYERNGQ